MLHAAILATALHVAANAHAREARAAAVLYASLNEERREHGLQDLPLDPALNAAALDHVADMARNNYFDHDSPTGITPWDRMHHYNCVYSHAGENIALAGSGVQAARALWNSPPHRENILSPNFTRVGIAVMTSRAGRLLFVEDFSD
jgi:uncharacterized protein YkwD